MLKEVVGALGAVLVLGLVAAPTAAAHDGHDHVLVLASTVSGGTTSIEATRVRELGFGVDLVDDDAFASMTRSAFEGYRGIVLGDPTCSGEEPRAAVEAAAAWGAAVDGNVVITGTDPVFHAGQGGEVLTRKSIDVALARPGRTGAYVSLSCSFHGAAPGTRVAMLDGLHPDGFTVKGVGCFNDAYVVASHEALDGLTNSMLSNWFCSVHEAFDRWPDTFDVLAIARGAGREFTAGDGTQGTPYILARGVRVISTITLAPDAATHRSSVLVLNTNSPAPAREKPEHATTTNPGRVWPWPTGTSRPGFQTSN
jgi:hypothetical protein